MDFGVGYFPTHDAIHPAELARLVEERGQEALFLAEHTHIPASRETPWPGGGELPPKYWHTLRPVRRADRRRGGDHAAAGRQRHLPVIERDPIITAKEVASVDHLSGGRFEFGVGAGWNREEMRNHGTDPRPRMALMRERVEAMKAIWTQDEASYDGEHVSFDRIWSYPKPAQRPHPPILVGGTGADVLDRVLAFGAAWFPNYDETIVARIAELRSPRRPPIDVQVLGAAGRPGGPGNASATPACAGRALAAVRAARGRWSGRWTAGRRPWAS